MRIVRLEARGVEWTEGQLSKFLARWVQYRTVHGLTHRQWADVLGCSVERVRRIEKGHEVPDGKLLLRFAAIERRQEDRTLDWVPGGDEVV